MKGEARGVGVAFSLVACAGLASMAASPGQTPSIGGTNVTAIVRLLDEQGRLTPPQAVDKVTKSDTEWRRLLTPEQYRVARRQGTEPAFCGAFHDHKKPGRYDCICCRLPLFDASAKFDSGTGWPSFFRPLCPENVVTRKDLAHGMVRTEILCARCDAHLGHVFEDGPPPTGLRYCLNSVSLVFVPASGPAPTPSR